MGSQCFGKVKCFLEELDHLYCLFTVFVFLLSLCSREMGDVVAGKPHEVRDLSEQTLWHCGIPGLWDFDPYQLVFASGRDATEQTPHLTTD